MKFLGHSRCWVCLAVVMGDTLHRVRWRQVASCVAWLDLPVM